MKKDRLETNSDFVFEILKKVGDYIVISAGVILGIALFFAIVAFLGIALFRHPILLVPLIFLVMVVVATVKTYKEFYVYRKDNPKGKNRVNK